MVASVLSNILATALLVLIRFYQLVISPLLPARCRFYPTCSSYAVKAMQRHGGFRGGLLTVKRICRCHPWGGSGVDFVPLPLYRYQYHFAGWANPQMKRTGFGVKNVRKIV